MSLPNGLQNPTRHVFIQNCLRESLPLAIKVGAQSILGNKTTEHGYDCCSRVEKVTAL